MRLLISFLSLLLSVSCGKLDEQENLKRLEECGTSKKTWEIVDWYIGDYWPPWPFKSVGRRHKRVSNGEQVSSHEAPWMVMVNFTAVDRYGDPRPHWTTGNIISTRHILTDSTVLLNRNPDGAHPAHSWIWRFNGRTEANVSSCTKTGYLEAPEEAVKDMFIRVCKATQICETGKMHKVKKAWYVGVCHEKIESFGMALLELSTNVKDVNPHHRIFPVCLPPKDLVVQPLDPLRLYALGPRNDQEYNEQVAEDRFYADIRRGDTVGRSCYYENGDEYYAYSFASICLDSNVCHADIGGAFVKEMDGGRLMAVAVARNGRCGYNRTQPQPAVHLFLTQICNLSGICHVDLNSTVTTTQKSIDITTTKMTDKPTDKPMSRTTRRLIHKPTTEKSIDIPPTTTEEPTDKPTDKPTTIPITESINTPEDPYLNEPQAHQHVQNGKNRTELIFFGFLVIFMIFLWIE